MFLKKYKSGKEKAENKRKAAEKECVIVSDHFLVRTLEKKESYL